ncbi:MAG TPA: host attachment protein [Kofleriaceae bacterium]
MKRACIAIVDAARARLFTYQEDADPGRELREVRDLTNPGRRLKQSEMFSETRPPLGQSGRPGPSGEPGSTKDDHRDDHVNMMDMKFAKEVIEEIEEIIRSEAYGRVILIAGPKMLGELRKANGALKRNGDLVVDEIPRDLANLTATQLHDHLASLDMIPGRQRLKMAR